MSKLLSLAYSPDTDDAFMVMALQDKLVPSALELGYEFSFHVDDIQVLNDAAKSGKYDITAISVAAWPSIADNYALLPIGGSIGDAFGPAVITQKGRNINGIDGLRGLRVAVPGLQTSAYYAAAVLTGGSFEPVPMYFLDIIDAVKSGRVDAGILIHERQLDCEQFGVHKIGDLGAWWHARFDLPLPLGCNAVRRSLGPETIAAVAKIYRESIQVGMQSRSSTLARALERSKAGISASLANRYIDMYVNRDSLDFSPAVAAGTKLMYHEAALLGLCSEASLQLLAKDLKYGAQV